MTRRDIALRAGLITAAGVATAGGLRAARAARRAHEQQARLFPQVNPTTDRNLDAIYGDPHTEALLRQIEAGSPINPADPRVTRLLDELVRFDHGSDQDTPLFV